MAGDGQSECDGGRNRLFLINLALAIHEFENFRPRPQETFGIADQKEPRRLEGIVKYGNNLLLQNRTQVDQNITAADQVHTREWRIAEDVLPRKHAHVSNGLGDLVSIGDLVEETPQANLRYFGRDALLVYARAGLLNRVLA